jgi:hypothetical protein
VDEDESRFDFFVREQVENGECPGDKRRFTIEHVDRYTGGIGIARYAGVVATVAKTGLRNQEFTRRAAIRLLRLQGNTAPARNA